MPVSGLYLHGESRFFERFREKREPREVGSPEERSGFVHVIEADRTHPKAFEDLSGLSQLFRPLSVGDRNQHLFKHRQDTSRTPGRRPANPEYR